MSDETYTLDEAKQELARRECAHYGHNWTVIEQYGPGPIEIVCHNCGKAYRVENPEAKR